MKYVVHFISLLLAFSAFGQNIQRVVPTVADLIASDPRTFASAPVFSSSTFTAVVTTTGGSVAGEGTKTWRWNASSTASTNTYANNGPLAYTGSLSTGRWENVLTVKEQAIQSQLDAVTVPENSLYTVSNTNQLRSLTAATLTNYSKVYMSGYYSDGDGGGGFLTVDLSDTATTDDGGSCFVVNGIRVKADLKQNDTVSIVRFGATKGDGIAEPSTGTAARIQAALDWGNSVLGATIFIPEGEWYCENTLHLHPRVNLKGTGMNFVDGTYPLISTDLEYRKSANSTLVLKSGANVPLIDLDPTGGSLRITNAPAKTQYGITIEGILFHGNWENQSRYDCHAMKLMNAWGIKIVNCGFARWKGYEMFVLDCNGIFVWDSFGIGQDTSGKAIFLWSVADSIIHRNKFGGGSGPIVWIAGADSWFSHYHDNMLYNANRKRYTASGVSANTITVTAAHTYETGMPVEVLSDGGTIPTGTTESTCYFAIKTGSTSLKLATTYANALAGTAISISGGSGTWYVFHGFASGIYASSGAVGLTLNNNRTEQHYDSGITLAKAYGGTVTGGILAQNGWYTQGQVMTGESMAGVELRNGARDFVIEGNSFFGSADKVQAYGVHLASDAGVNTVGFNSYPQYIGTNVFNEADEVDLIKPVSAIGDQASIGNYLTVGYVPLTLKGGTSGSWLQEWDRTNGVVQKYGVRVGTSFMFGDRTQGVDLFGGTTLGDTMRRLNLGSDTGRASPKEGRVHAEDATGTDVSGASMRLEVGKGTGAATVSAFYVDTPAIGSTGTTAQTLVTRLRAGESGVGINRTTANASGAQLQVDSTTGGVLVPRMTGTQRDAISSPTDGTILYNSTTGKLQVRAGGAWVDLH